MATRKTQTPGATEPVEEVQAQEEQVQETVGQPVAEEVRDTAILEVLDTILENQKRIENKVDSLLSAGGIEQPKKKRWVQGTKGLVHKEID